MKENENVSRIADEWWREFQETRTRSPSPPDGEGESRAEDDFDARYFAPWGLELSDLAVQMEADSEAEADWYPCQMCERETCERCKWALDEEREGASNASATGSDGVPEAAEVGRIRGHSNLAGQ